jgi:hypothetical protein
MAISIKIRNRAAAVHAPLTHANLKWMRDIPSKKHWEGNVLVFEPTAPALDYVRTQAPDAEWDEDTKRFAQLADEVRASAIKAEKRDPIDFQYKTKPFDHQEKVFKLSRDAKAFALLMEQGTGKSKVIADNAAWLYAKGEITGLLVVAKNGVHQNWTNNEIPAHLPDWVPREMYCWRGKKGEKSIKGAYSVKDKLAILTVNIEALSTKKGLGICERFLLAYTSFFVVDESTSIKTPSAKRTKSALKLGRLAPYRRILTGTPITKGPLDAYSQFAFLDEDILGFGSFYTFRARYAVLQDLPGKQYHGRPVKVVVAYQNLDELQAKIKPYSFRVLKKDCLDLPPKLYRRHYFEMTEEQWKHYKEMEEDIVTEFQGRRISAPLAMTRLMRLHQIACGFMPPEDPKKDMGVPINATNPRLEALMDLLEEIDEPVIIFGIYRFSLNEVYQAIAEKYGKETIIAYKGDVAAADEFQNNPQKRFFIGQTHGAGYGLTLHKASTVIYYSNDHALEARLQSEDRPHRIGQTANRVLYIDMQATDTIDGDIIDNLRTKLDVANQITGDAKNKNWMENSQLEINKNLLSKYRR